MSMIARDIDRHMRQIGSYVDFAETCDTFKFGDPKAVVRGIAVSWISSIANLREAHERGCNLFITHEPTLYSHMDNDPAFDDDAFTKEKRALLEQTGMVVYRCHDVWDRYPGLGILDSWAGHLGLTAEPIASEMFWRVVPIEPTPAERLAREVAGRLGALGQEAVQLVGDPQRTVSQVGIGTGAIASGRDFHRLGADVGIVTEITWWRDARWAMDTGMPLLVVDHTVSEEPGILNLTRYLAETFDDVPVEYIPTHCPYRLIDGRLGD